MKKILSKQTLIIIMVFFFSHSIKAEELMITSGKNPMAMAATVVYMASIINEEKVSQTRVSIAAGISSVTIRNLCKKLKDAKIAVFADPKLKKVTED